MRRDAVFEMALATRRTGCCRTSKSTVGAVIDRAHRCFFVRVYGLTQCVLPRKTR